MSTFAPEFATDLEANIPTLRRYARRLTRDVASADDLVQNCLLRALTRSHLFEPGTDLRAWLFKMMHNVHINEVRRSIKHQAAVSLDDLTGFEPSVPASQEARVDFSDFMRMFEALPAGKRKTVMLVGWDGMSYEEAADALGVPAGTVRSRLSRARDQLRQNLGEGLPMARQDVALPAQRRARSTARPMAGRVPAARPVRLAA
jgi:RNA polymerase sigma-70 factor (ECF subfamily)